MNEDSRVWEHIHPRDDEQPTPTPPAAVHSATLFGQALGKREEGKTFDAIELVLQGVARAQHEGGTHGAEALEWGIDLLRAWYPKTRTRRRGRR